MSFMSKIKNFHFVGGEIVSTVVVNLPQCSVRCFFDRTDRFEFAQRIYAFVFSFFMNADFCV